MDFAEKDLKINVYHFYFGTEIIDSIDASSLNQAMIEMFNRGYKRSDFDFVLEIDKKFNFKKPIYINGKQRKDIHL